MAKMGRPPKLTPEVRERFLEAIRNRNTIKNACHYAGIHPSTFYDWQEYARFGRPVGFRGELIEFLDSYKKIEAEALNECVVRIGKAGSGEMIAQRVTTTRTLPDGTVEETVTETLAPAEWRADAWILERRNPREWGRRDRTPVDVQREAERLARELGMPVDELLAEAEMLAQSEG